MGRPRPGLATFITLHFHAHCTACPIKEPHLHDGRIATPQDTRQALPLSPPLQARVGGGVGRVAVAGVKGKGNSMAKTGEASTTAATGYQACLLLLRGRLGQPWGVAGKLPSCRVQGLFIHCCKIDPMASSLWPFNTHLYPYPYAHHTTQTGASLFRSTMSAKTVSQSRLSVLVRASLPCLDSSALQARMMTRERGGEGNGKTRPGQWWRVPSPSAGVREIYLCV